MTKVIYAVLKFRKRDWPGWKGIGRDGNGLAKRDYPGLADIPLPSCIVFGEFIKKVGK